LAQRSQGTGAGNPLIVVVDDEARVRGLLKDLLTRKGYTVSVTADPKRGLKMLMGQKPALVILGLKRSEMDGLDLLRKMKTYDEMMPVIVTTHLVNIRLAKEGVRLGAFDYVLKPFDPAFMIWWRTPWSSGRWPDSLPPSSRPDCSNGKGRRPVETTATSTAREENIPRLGVQGASLLNPERSVAMRPSPRALDDVERLQCV
jgi:CheY-like chemotaxis protein